MASSRVITPVPDPEALDTVHTLVPSGEQMNSHSTFMGLAPDQRCPSVKPWSRAAASAIALNAEPGLRRPCTARSNWLNSKSRPEAMTFTAPVWLSTMAMAPVGRQEWVSA